MKLTCPHCQKEIRLRQKYPYHAGFSDRGFLYCDSCPAILLFDAYNYAYAQIVGNKSPWVLNDDEKRKVENTLQKCKCGGQFLFDAKPRCPHCNRSIASLLPDNIHFLEIGEVYDADKQPSVWKSAGNHDREK